MQTLYKELLKEEHNQQQPSKVISNLAPPDRLKVFQQEFGNYLRSQLHEDKNIIPRRVGELYQSLIFNNLKGFINQCFPVCQTLMSKEHWQDFTLYFFQQGELHSPYFTEINQHFVDFLYSMTDSQRAEWKIPEFMADLAHYEYVELQLDIEPDAVPETVFLRHIYPNATINPNLHNLHYQWSVHLIDGDNQPTEPVDTFIAVYRTPQHKIEFMEVNALTHLLIDFMSKHIKQSEEAFVDKTSLLLAFLQSVDMAGQDNEIQLIHFGMELLNQLENQQVIIELDKL